MPRDSDSYRPYLDQGRVGFVYLLTNPHMKGLVKIGATRKHPLQRAKELGAGTGVPGEFTIAYFRDFADCFAAETLVHQAFVNHRVNDSREFFEATVAEVVDYLDGLSTSNEYRAELASVGIRGGSYGDDGLDGIDNAILKARVRETPPASVATPWADLFASFPDDGSPRELTPEEQTQCHALEQTNPS